MNNKIIRRVLIVLLTSAWWAFVVGSASEDESPESVAARVWSELGAVTPELELGDEYVQVP